MGVPDKKSAVFKHTTEPVSKNRPAELLQQNQKLAAVTPAPADVGQQAFFLSHCNTFFIFLFTGNLN